NSVTEEKRTRLSPEDRRRQLLGIGLRMLVEKPIQDLPLDAVAAEAGISRGLLFHYFPTKTDYYDAVIDAALRRVLRNISPDGIVDPHVHQWNPLTNPGLVTKEARAFRRIPRIPRALRWVLPRADREFVGNPHHVLKPYLPLSYRADAGEVPVATVVHIEAAWPHEPHDESVNETRWISSLPFGVDGAPKLGAIVARVDPRWSDAGDLLDEHLEASPLVR